MNWNEKVRTDRTWRVRARLVDRPGTLAALAASLGEHGCNLLAVSVLPVLDAPATVNDSGFVVDELVLRAPGAMRSGELMGVVDRHGTRCLGVVPASVEDLVDEQTAALRIVVASLTDTGSIYEALRRILGADRVWPVTQGLSDPVAQAGTVRGEPGGHRATITLREGEQVLATRGWAPFTAVELARVPQLLGVLSAVGRRLEFPVAVRTVPSVGAIVRLAQPEDAPAVASSHRRLMAATLKSLRRAGHQRMPSGWAERLITVPRGQCLVAVAGREVIGFVQLVAPRGDTATTALALHVEDGWRRLGVGATLLSSAYELAAASGVSTLTAQCLPDPAALPRTATRAELSSSVRIEDGLPGLTLTRHPPRATENVDGATRGAGYNPKLR